MFKVPELAQRREELKKKVENALSAIGEDSIIRDNSDSIIRLVFAGQYSSGKSSILKMLTGRDDIEIGAGIQTQEAHEYDWNGIKVIDTPGIHTSIRPDHDEISYEAISSADMLVFVITNELFDSYIATHFRKLAIDKDKAGEMVLVVNKMDRANNGNTAEQQNIIKEDLEKVLVPYSPDQLNISFLDAQSFLDSIEEREEDPELADELVERSGYDKFINTLNRFVKKHSLASKLTTELYLIDSKLEKVIKKLQPNSEDDDIDALEENLLQQRHLLIESRGRLQQEVKDIFTDAGSRIRDIGLSAANLLVAGCKQVEVEEKLQLYVNQAENLIENCQYEVATIINSRLNEVDQELNIIENSNFSQNLKMRLSGKFEGLPDNVKKIISTAGPGFQKAGQAVINNAYKVGTQGGLKLTNFSGSTIHQMVIKGGHAINFKFKPWQAIKITKGIAIGGQVLSVLGVGLGVFMQIKSDHDEEVIRADLRKNRQNIRSQFNAAANELESFARQYVKDTVIHPLEASIISIDDNIQSIRETRSTRSSNCRELEELQKECRWLISSIHAEERY